jgi:TonB family protein
VIFLAFNARWNYKIYGSRGPARDVFLAPRDFVRFQSRPGTAAEPGGGEPRRAVEARPDAAGDQGGRGAETRPEARPGDKPPAAVPDGGAAAGGAEPGRSGGSPAGFDLVYPRDARISLAQPAAKVPDTLVSPNRYRSRADIDFFKYVRPGATGSGGGPLGGGGGPGQAERRARRPGGADLVINVPGIDFKPWGETVLTRVQRNWALPGSAGSAWQGQVGITVLVAKTGQLLAVEMDSPSKLVMLDEAALQAVHKSGPFPALPAAFAGSSLEVYFVFKYGD